MRRFVVLAILLGVSGSVVAQDEKPQKYALLIGVKQYEHPEINEQKLAYPEVDAEALRDLLVQSGYEIDLLLGKKATYANIQNKLEGISAKGGNDGVVVVGLFGHGIEFDQSKKSYFCPYDTQLKAIRDENGRVVSRDDGQPRTEPDAKKMIAIDDILVALKVSKATNRVLVADCCRNDPNAARGRSFGTSLAINQLPINTAVLFACSTQEKAHEHQDWGHGAFTKCLLEAIQENSAQGKSLMGRIAEDVKPAVEKLVSDKARESQSPRLLSTGARIDLQLRSVSIIPVDRAEFDRVISSYKGKVVLVYGWAMWDKITYRHTFEIEKFRQQHSNQLVVIALNMDDREKGAIPKSVVRFVEQNHTGFVQLISKLDISDDGQKAFNITEGRLPHFKVYGRNGRLIKEFQEEATDNWKREDVQNLLTDEIAK